MPVVSEALSLPGLGSDVELETLAVLVTEADSRDGEMVTMRSMVGAEMPATRFVPSVQVTTCSSAEQTQPAPAAPT